MSAQDRLTLRNVYLYLVCLITLVVALFAAVSLVRSIVSLAYPDPYNYGYYYPGDPAMEDVSPEEIERQEQLAEDGARRQALLDVVSSATTLLIAGPLYVYHWRRVQRELPWRNGQQVPDGPPLPGGPPVPGGQQGWGGQQPPAGGQGWGGQQVPGGQQPPGGSPA